MIDRKNLYRILPFILFTALLAGLFPGCASAPVDEQQTDLTGERLINRLEANRRKIRAFEAKGTISVNTPNFSNSAAFRVIIRKPDSLHIEIYGPFGLELAQILLTDKNYIFYEALNNVAYKGESIPQLFTNVFRIELPYRDVFGALVDIFTGSVNFSERLYKEPTFFDVIQDKYIITFQDSTHNLSTRYEIASKELSPLSAKTSTLTQDILLESIFSNHAKHGNSVVPMGILVRYPQGKQSIAIEYKSVLVNDPAVSIDFQLPEDADIIQW